MWKMGGNMSENSIIDICAVIQRLCIITLLAFIYIKMNW
jgi:hypothetical protein